MAFAAGAAGCATETGSVNPVNRPLVIAFALPAAAIALAADTAAARVASVGSPNLLSVLEKDRLCPWRRP